jgi:hypothetical protein
MIAEGEQEIMIREVCGSLNVSKESIYPSSQRNVKVCQQDLTLDGQYQDVL